MTQTSGGGPLSGLIDQMAALARRDRVALSDVVGALGEGAALPMLVITAAVVVSPLSGIPFVSSLCGIIIMLTASQLLVGMERVWLPARLSRLALPGTRVASAAQRLLPLASWLDRRSSRRWRLLYRNPVRSVLLICCMGAGALMPFLELVPFSSSILGLFVLLIAFGLLVRDGVVTAIAILPVGTLFGTLIVI